MLIYSPYLSLKLTCTPNTHKLLIKPFVKPYMLAVAFILNFLWLLVKWIRWYFSGINITLYWCAYAVHILYALFKALQFFFVILLYISILELLINPTTIIVPPCNSGKNMQAKKKNRINNSTEI